MSTTLHITASGAFDLGQAAAFLAGFTPAGQAGGPDGLDLAFCRDAGGERGTARVTQDADGVHVRAASDADAAQAARMLSLDVDAAQAFAVLARDPATAAALARRPGLRPVLFGSPYEAAAWAILSMRANRAQALRVRERMAGGPGYPTPAQVLAAGAVQGLPDEKLRRLQGVAEAALDGRLDAARLRAMPEDEALARVRELRGIGPFAAELVLARGAGLADLLAMSEPRMRRAAAELGGGEGTPGDATWREMAEAWRPYRAWACFLLRAATD